MINYFYESENIPEQIYSIASSNSAGIILLATEMENQDMRHFTSLEIPVVILDNYFPDWDCICIAINNYQGAK